MTWRYLDWPGPIALAHRGGAEDWPENTMRAFAGAVSLGYRYVETDVHATADGVLLAFHDDRLDRVSDRTGVIAELPWKQVRAARIAGESIPLLEDLLGTWPDLRVNIDIKHENAIERLVEALRRTGAEDRVCVGSFSQSRLMRFRRQTAGHVCTSLGPVEVAALRAASYGPGLASGRLPLAGAAAQVPTRAHIPLVDQRFVATAHRRGLQVHVWTINDEREMDRLLDLDVDGLITDRPALLRDVLVRRGQWVETRSG
jgi:glycerophosphoryl diester phosphodiesterase